MARVRKKAATISLPNLIAASTAMISPARHRHIIGVVFGEVQQVCAASAAPPPKGRRDAVPLSSANRIAVFAFVFRRKSLPRAASRKGNARSRVSGILPQEQGQSPLLTVRVSRRRGGKMGNRPWPFRQMLSSCCHPPYGSAIPSFAKYPPSPAASIFFGLGVRKST